MFPIPANLPPSPTYSLSLSFTLSVSDTHTHTLIHTVIHTHTPLTPFDPHTHTHPLLGWICWAYLAWAPRQFGVCESDKANAAQFRMSNSKQTQISLSLLVAGTALVLERVSLNIQTDTNRPLFSINEREHALRLKLFACRCQYPQNNQFLDTCEWPTVLIQTWP